MGLLLELNNRNCERLSSARTCGDLDRYKVEDEIDMFISAHKKRMKDLSDALEACGKSEEYQKILDEIIDYEKRFDENASLEDRIDFSIKQNEMADELRLFLSAAGVPGRCGGRAYMKESGHFEYSRAGYRELRGDTYCMKDEIAKAGGKWEPSLRCWLVPRASYKALRMELKRIEDLRVEYQKRVDAGDFSYHPN